MEDLNICKKKTLSFKLSNFSKPNPDRVKKVAGALASFLTSISVATFFTNHETVSFILLITQVALRELVIPLFGETEEVIITPEKCEDIDCEKIE
jgi:hypothetical protein